MIFPRCKKCGLALIEEEYDIHVCCIDEEIWAYKGNLWVGDGERAYPLNPDKLHRPPANEQLFRNNLRRNTTQKYEARLVSNNFADCVIDLHPFFSLPIERTKLTEGTGRPACRQRDTSGGGPLIVVVAFPSYNARAPVAFQPVQSGQIDNIHRQLCDINCPQQTA